MTLLGGIVRFSVVGIRFLVRGKDELEDAIRDDVELLIDIQEKVLWRKDGEYKGGSD